ncbi:MAG: hypothetical protein QXR83_04785 [Archaeoglobaceae archaeon]
MMLRPLSLRIKEKLLGWSKKLNIRLAEFQETDCILFVTNGTPDDVVCLIISHKFDGKSVVGITKPKKTRDSAIPEVLNVIGKMKVKKIALIVDQEEEELADLWRRIEKRLHDCGVKYSEKEKEERFRSYECKLGPRDFELLVCINGLDKPYIRHTIEDHLVEASKKLGKDSPPEDPKEAWKGLEEDEQLKVYHYLSKKADMNEIERLFPQQVKLFEALITRNDF